jgi:SAM-dependent methyltransferase
MNKKIMWNRTWMLWKKYASKYWWGDPLDVRFYLCSQLNTVHDKKILDVGCNVGIILNCADDSNIKQGFDLDADSIKIAKRINKEFGLNADFYVKDAFKSNLKKNSFDILILSDVLPGFDYGPDKYDFDDCKRFVNKCTSYLKHGGILYLTTPNGENPYYLKKHKTKISQIRELLEKNYDFEVGHWNPLPISLGHVLKFFPGWFCLLEFLMARGIAKNRCISFYVRAVKK